MNTPKSPNKPLPEAPEKTIPHPTRTHRSSHSGVEASAQGSRTKASSSSYSEQTIAVKRVEPVMRVMSSELRKPMKSPKSSTSREAPETAPLVKSSSSTSPTPNSTLSRRESFSERTRSITRKFSFFKDDKDNKQHNPDPATQNAQIHEPTGGFPLSSPTRRSSSRKANAVSVSAYSTSPTSPKKALESPIRWEANTQNISKLGEPVPSQSAYAKMDFLPAQPALSPLTDKSFTFGEDFRFPTHSRSSSHKYLTPSISRYEAEHKNSEPSLSHEVYPSVGGAIKPSDKPPRPTRDVLEASTEKSSIPAGAYQGTDWNTKNSPRGLKSTESDRIYHDGSHQPQKPPITNLEGAGTSTVSLLLGPQQNPQVIQGPTSPAITELEAPLPPSHPLLLEPRHLKHFASKTPPPSPPIQPARDLPLRHYRSQEQISAPGGSLRKDEPLVIAEPSNSRGASSQVSPDIKAVRSESSFTTTLLPATPQSFVPSSSTIRLIAVPSSEIPTTKSANQLHNSPTAIPPILDRVSSPKEGSKLVSNLQPESPAARGVDPNNVVVVPSKTDNLEAPKSPPQQLSSGLPAPDLFPSTYYKASATRNAPFFLSPNSSTALIDFLATTPPSTHPEPQLISQSSKINNVPTTSQESNDAGHNVEHAAAAPSSPGVRGAATISSLPHSTHGPTLAFSLNSVPPPTSAQPLAIVEKTPKWKKMFGARGAARQKSSKTGPEVIIVGKGEWYKIDRKKKQKGQSSTQADGPDVIGNAGLADQKPTTTVGTGIMGTGKDGVWISGENFLKS